MSVAKQERVWLAAGALIGVVVAGVVIAVLVVLQGGGDAGGARVPSAPPSTRVTAADTGDPARARDEALKAAEEALVAMNTMDSKTAQESVTRWESLATSPLLDELRTKHAENVALFSGSKTMSSAKVLASAVSKMTGDGSTVDVLVYLEVSTTDAKGTGSRQVREKAVMIQTADGWKVSVRNTIQPPA